MSRTAGIIVVAVKPGAKAPGIIVGPGNTVTVRVRERATEGRANEAVRTALARAVGVPPRDVTLVRGATARLKSFAVAGLTSTQIRARLESLSQA